jgi:hypothetical protein
MNRVTRITCLVLLISTPLQAFAFATQSPQPRKPSAANVQPAAIQKVVSVLDQLLDTQKSFADENLAIITQVQVGDMLWGIDETRARGLLESSFQALTTQISRSSPPRSSALWMIHNPIRDIVLQTIAHRSAALAVNLARGLAGPGESNERVSLEYQLGFFLMIEDPQRSAEIVRPLVGRVETFRLMSVIRSLRWREPMAADDIFIQAFEKLRFGQPGLEEIRALTSYLFPYFGDGLISFSSSPEPHDPFKPIAISPRVIDQFIGFAYDAAYRRLDAALANIDSARLDPRTQDFTILKLLAPYFDRLLPERAVGFRARLEEAVHRVPIEERPYLALSEPGIEQLVAMADTVSDARVRDTLYQRAASRAGLRNYDQALAIVEKISNERFRLSERENLRQRRAEGRSDEIRQAIAAGEFDIAEEMIAAIPNARSRQWMLRSLVSQMFIADKTRATRTIDAAERSAMNLENQVECARDLMMLAGVIAGIDVNRGFEKMEQAISELNRAGLASDWEKNQQIEITLAGEKEKTIRSLNVGVGTLFSDPDFQSLGSKDFSRALGLARQVQVPGGSVLAQLAVCRGALSKLPAVPDTAQQKALALLDQLLETAKSFEDDELKIRIQTQIADLIWERDERRARRLFETAFQAIASTRLPVPDKNVPPSFIGSDSHFSLRNDVIAQVTQHDPVLAEKLIDSVLDQPPNVDPKFANSPYGTYSERDLLRFQFAHYITRSDSRRAAQIAVSLLQKGDFYRTLSIAGSLRGVDQSMADDLCTQVLSQARLSNPPSNETVRLLADYVLPGFGEGTMRFISRAPGVSQRPKASPALRAQFLDLAYDAIMQWTTPPKQNLDRPSSGENPGQQSNLTIARLLLPFLDEHVPEKSAALRSRVSEASKTAPGYRDVGDIDAAELLSRAERSSNANERDSIYRVVVMNALRRGDLDRAAQIFDKISDERTRLQLDSGLRLARDEDRSRKAQTALDGGDFDTASKLINEMDRSRRIGMLCRMAVSLFYKKEAARAAQVLKDAEQLSVKTEDRIDRLRELFQIAGIAARLDLERGFEQMTATVEAINHAGLGPEWVKQETLTDAKTGAVIGRRSVGLQVLSALLFDNGLAQLASADFDRTMTLAQALRPKEASVFVQLGICRGLLNNSRRAIR